MVGHRGLLFNAPENTLASFAACLALQVGFEFDVDRTADGALVCVHDANVDRTTDGSGTVSDLTLAEIKRLDAGGQSTLAAMVWYSVCVGVRGGGACCWWRRVHSCSSSTLLCACAGWFDPAFAGAQVR